MSLVVLKTEPIHNGWKCMMDIVPNKIGVEEQQQNSATKKTTDMEEFHKQCNPIAAPTSLCDPVTGTCAMPPKKPLSQRNVEPVDQKQVKPTIVVDGPSKDDAKPVAAKKPEPPCWQKLLNHISCGYMYATETRNGDTVY